jgi:transposase
LLGLQEIAVDWIKEDMSGWQIGIRSTALGASCPACGHCSGKRHDRRRQWVRHVPIGERAVRLQLEKRRFRCLHDGRVFAEPLGWLRRYARLTSALEAWLWREARAQPLAPLADRAEVGPGQLSRLFFRQAQRQLAKRRMPAPRVLGLDGFSLQGGHRFALAVCDLERHALLEVAPRDDGVHLRAYLNALAAPEAVQAVVIDGSEVYRQAIQEVLPHARIVLDRFHALRQVTVALDKIRVRLQGQTGQGQRGPLFRARFRLLKAAERLTADQRRELDGLLTTYPELQLAWRAKEHFRAVYRQQYRPEAEAELASFALTALEVPELQRLLHSSLDRWWEEILNYVELPFTTGFVEGKNNRIKVVKRMAYGYRNFHRFRLRLLATA